MIRKRAHTIANDDRGAVDIASTVVVVVLLLALASAIMLNTFTVVPWAQDAMARKSLSSVVEAQRIAYAMEGHYVDKQRLTDLGLITRVGSGAEMPPALAVGRIQQGLSVESWPFTAGRKHAIPPVTPATSD